MVKRKVKSKVIRKRITNRNKKRIEALFNNTPARKRVNTFLRTK